MSAKRLRSKNKHMQRQEKQKDCFLPDFCNIRTTFAIVVAAELLAVILTVASYQSVEKFWSDLSMLSLYIQWIALGSASSLCLLKSGLKRLDTGKAGLFALILLLLVTAVVSTLSYKLVIEQASGLSLQAFVWQSLIISFIIGVLSLHYFYMQYRLGLQQRAEADARFQALQARIRPHFLFNSMNTIAHLTRADPHMAEKVVEDLADLFRAALVDIDKTSSLQDEIELAKGYLNIESMRLGERLQVQWDIDPQLQPILDKIPLPSIMFQPLLENSVYHGIEPSAQGGQIKIAIKKSDDNVQIEIKNTVEQVNHQSHRQGNRIALDNTRQRLLAFYGESAAFEIQDTGNRYQINMMFPFQKSLSE